MTVVFQLNISREFINCSRGIRKVTPNSKIKDFLISNNLLHPEDVISGIDVTIKSSLKSYHDFKKLLESCVLRKSRSCNN